MSGHDDLKDSLAEVIQGAKLKAKSRGTSIKPAVETLGSACYENGVLPDDLKELIDLVTTSASNYLDQASLNSIIRNLYPATKVASEIVIKVVACLGHGVLKPSLAIQAALLRWVIMIHHVVDGSALSQSYPVLFNLLDTAALRPSLCQLLAMITRRRHVRPHRIQTLLSLSRQTGSDPALTGLLRVFKDYYPEIIVGEATRGKASAFKHPDLAWRERLDEIQSAHAQASRDANAVQDAFHVARNGSGGARKGALIPEVHTSHANESSVTLEEIENADGLVKALETIEMPNQLISVLSDPLLQKLLLLRPDAESLQRASNWLVSCAQDLVSGDGDSELEGILEIMRDYARAARDLPPVFLTLLSEVLKTWNGRGRASMFEVLSYAPLPSTDFSGLYEAVFQRLEAKVLDGTPGSQLAVLGCYTSLLRNWAAFLLAQPQGRDSTSSAIPDLVTHVNKLALTVLQTAASNDSNSSSTIATHSAVLDFYEEASRIASNPQLLRHAQIVIPPPPLVYLLHFSGSPATVSRLCGVLARYKAGFQAAMAGTVVSSRKMSDTYSVEYINEFNGFLMDVCNCLWRSRAFNAKDANAHGCLLAAGVVEDLAAYVRGFNLNVALPAMFTLSASPAFGALATAHLRDLEEVEQGLGDLDVRHAGPVTKSTLAKLARDGGVNLSWDDYRLGVLGHLEDHGMSGVAELMNCTMTTLMKKS
ncbi:Mis6-domain-containing protein [Apiospora aurea]|uniref:Mis6-domain-containing protein n=1 Tax=Apiospora aurea TaxID=335848 RepID=A0ABR1QTE5_9PEZI